MDLNTQSYYEHLSAQAAAHPDREAVVMGEEHLTYRQMLNKVDHVASMLLSAGIQHGEKVVIWAKASPLWLCAYYGIIRAGAVAVVLNANLTIKDAAPLVEFADSTAVFFGATHDTTGAPEDAAVLAEAFHLPAGRIINIETTDFTSVNLITPDTAGWDVKDDAYIIYTSGTTSFPKAVLTSQFGIINASAQLAAALGTSRGDRAVMAVPLFHAYGLMVSWIYLSNGGTILIPDRIKSDDVANLVEKENATDLWSVAVIYQGIIDDENLAGKVSPRIHLCTIAGSYTTPIQFMRYETVLKNATFVNMYGMTETCAAYCLTRPDDPVSVRYYSVGRPIDGVEAAVWDEEKGILPQGEVGEIITRGFHLKNSYYKLPAEKQAVDQDGWLHSGDLGVFDENGSLHIVGRIKDLIIKGGENIAPAEIEAEVQSIPAIKECRIFGFHDPIYGENLGACITLNPGCEFDEPAVRKHMKAKVGSYKSPVLYFIFDAFPLNANGKIDQRQLHNEMLTRLRRQFLAGELDKGIRIASLSIKNSTYGIIPVSSMLEAYAKCLGFGQKKATRIRLATEEALNMRINETANDIDDIHMEILCYKGFLRLNITDSGMNESADRKENVRRSAAIILRIVDNSHITRLPNGLYQVQLDFAYDKDFNVEDFLMAHEPIQ